MLPQIYSPIGWIAVERYERPSVAAPLRGDAALADIIVASPRLRAEPPDPVNIMMMGELLC